MIGLKVYESCAECPLTAFEKYLLKKDKTALIKSDIPEKISQEQDIYLTQIGHTLYSEYCELIDDMSMLAFLKKKQALYALILKVEVCRKLVEILSTVYDKGIHTQLNKWGYVCELDLNNPNLYEKSMNVVKVRMKGDEMIIKRIMKELEDVQAKSAKAQDAKKTYFDEALLQIEKHRQITLLPYKDQLKVQQFCVYVNDMRKSAIKKN